MSDPGSLKQVIKENYETGKWNGCHILVNDETYQYILQEWPKADEVKPSWFVGDSALHALMALPLQIDNSITAAWEWRLVDTTTKEVKRTGHIKSPLMGE